MGRVMLGTLPNGGFLSPRNDHSKASKRDRKVHKMRLRAKPPSTEHRQTVSREYVLTNLDRECVKAKDRTLKAAKTLWKTEIRDLKPEHFQCAHLEKLTEGLQRIPRNAKIAGERVYFMPPPNSQGLRCKKLLRGEVFRVIHKTRNGHSPWVFFKPPRRWKGLIAVPHDSCYVEKSFQFVPQKLDRAEYSQPVS